MRKITLVAGFIFGLTGLCMAQQEEKLTITTYYPSPTGVYQTLKVVDSAEFNTGLYSGYNHVVIHGKDPGSSYGVLSFSANNTAGNVNIASIWGLIENDTVGTESGGLVFATKSSSGTMDTGERMRISADGSVSIGSSSTPHRFFVSTNTTNDGMVIQNGTTWLKVMSGSVGDGSYNSIVRADDTALIYSNGTQGTGALVIAPWAAATSGLRMDGNGHVGIGNVSPQADLAVVNSTAGSGIKIAEFLSPVNNNEMNYIRVGRTLTSDGATFGYMFDSSSNIAGGFIGDFQGNPKLFVNGLGNVGIGTTAPVAKLVANLVNPSGWSGNLKALRLLSPDNNYYLDIDTYIAGASNVGYHFSPNANTGLVITTPGYVGIGKTAPVVPLDIVSTRSGAGATDTARWSAPNKGPNVSHVHWDTYGDWYIRPASSSGSVYIKNYVAESDISKKEDISDLKYGLSSVMNLQPRTFRWKNSDAPAKTIGFVAQEVELVVPELVFGKEGDKGVGDMTAVLVKAIQEQQKQIESLKAEVASLQKKRKSFF